LFPISTYNLYLQSFPTRRSSDLVSKVLQTVVNNLEITNNLTIEPEVRCRVLLTTPLEAFIVGHTIVVSRGLLDVLPDESSLAMVDRKSTRLNSSHGSISYAVFCL